MSTILLGRQASTPFSHGLSQPIDQCKSKPVTSGHDILWLDFKCVYRSESLCTCRQKHWGCRPTQNARRFQLHLCICQGASELWPLWKQRAAQEHARPLWPGSGRHRSTQLQTGAAFLAHLRSFVCLKLCTEILWSSKGNPVSWKLRFACIVFSVTGLSV